MSTPLLKLRPEVKAAWLEALRSGKYDQTKSKLRRDMGGAYGFCCLGVLTDLFDKATNADGMLAGWALNGDYRHEGGTPPDCVIEWAFENVESIREAAGGGFSDCTTDVNAVLVEGEHGTASIKNIYLTNRNDGQSWTFEQIADEIEAKL